jgi:DNA-binding NarL/FixJ family response regulator
VARSGSFVRGFRELVAVALDALRPARDEAPIVQETTPDDPRKAPKLRVLIVDDDIRVRRALRSLIECAPDLIVVGEARSTASAKRLDLELLPDVVVLDLLLPQALDGMGVLRELRGRGRPVVAISGTGELGPRATVAGAHAFLEKHGRDVDDLLDMIRAACRHDPWPRGD